MCDAWRVVGTTAVGGVPCAPLRGGGTPPRFWGRHRSLLSSLCAYVVLTIHTCLVRPNLHIHHTVRSTVVTNGPQCSTTPAVPHQSLPEVPQLRHRPQPFCCPSKHHWPTPYTSLTGAASLQPGPPNSSEEDTAAVAARAPSPPHPHGRRPEETVLPAAAATLAAVTAAAGAPWASCANGSRTASRCRRNSKHWALPG